MTYLHQHSRTLKFELDFKNPKEYHSEKEPRSQGSASKKRTRPQEDRTKRSSNKRHKTPRTGNDGATKPVPFKFQCKRAECIQRGTSKNHTSNQCKFKDGASTKVYPNIGKAPPKRLKKPNRNATPKQGGAPVVPQRPNQSGANPPTSTFVDTRTCYICNAKGHIATTCPQKQANKNNAKVRLKTNQSFMALWKTSFPTEPENLCATRILEAWDEPNYCATCVQPAGFAHVCRQEDRHVHQHVQKVKQQMTSTSMLNDIIEAHQPYTSSTEENSSATIDSSFFFHAGGHEPPQPRGLVDIQQETEDQFESEQESDGEHSAEDSRSERSDDSQDERSENGFSDQQQTDDEAPYESDISDHEESD